MGYFAEVLKTLADSRELGLVTLILYVQLQAPRRAWLPIACHLHLLMGAVQSQPENNTPMCGING